MLDGLGALVGGRVRLWRFDGRALKAAAGSDPGTAPAVPRQTGLTPTPAGTVWLEPIGELEGFWLEVGGLPDRELTTAASRVMPIIAALLDVERQRAFLAEELTSRYEEIDLLYAISEILGQTVQLEEATQTIAREVSTVVGARRASIMVFDESAGVLRTVAARGFGLDGLDPVRVDDECSVAARVYRERRVLAYDPSAPDPENGECGEPRGYRGQAFLSVPICYGSPGSPLRCVGVINLTDRLGGDRFTLSDRKLVTAVANQIGAAVENSRLVDRDRLQQRLRYELELAHDLQLKLLPSPAVLQGDAEVAARCYPAESVGGDFYTFSRLGRGRVGVMLGDVASHGFSAALVMALVMSAAGIHAAASITPDETLSALLESLSTELTSTEMYFSVFYGVLDPLTGRLSYASAGHPYAFRVPRFGAPERLEATAPPLGLATAGSIQRRQVPWSIDHDLLVLWTDGLADARNEAGEPFGEQRLLDAVCAHRTEAPDTIVDAVMAEADRFGAVPIDDRTILVLRI
ncbi:MAG TPA: GAF domain-containing SpoIIE family protein phosphatase [Gemmatimonadales bacterium]|nr:GAF domain-containing SpoIIE family protein phosphatase [Gemmatimonadales bacterium]